jgi:hypothetical protein
LSKIFCILCAICVCLFVTPGVFAARTIKMTAEPCFGTLASGGVSPLDIRIQNVGRSARGSINVTVLQVSGGRRVYSYPIDLPSGTLKRLIAYPELSDSYSSISVSFDGPVEVKPIDITNDEMYSGYGQNQIQVGYIGDDSGTLSPLRMLAQKATAAYSSGTYSPTASQPTTYSDCYCTPEAAPDRSIGYNAYPILVLGEGSDRLDTDQWNAIHEWVIGGGSLVMIGGSGSLTYLDSPGAAPLCPLGNIHQTTLPLVNLSSAVKSQQFANVGAVTGLLVPGATARIVNRQSPIVVSRHLGAGLVTLITVDPFVQPISGVDGNAKLLTWLLTHSQSGCSDAALYDWYSQQFTGATNSSGSAIAVANPFLIKLPPYSEIAWIFATYFILAIPVTYFVLRRVRRLEIAWISTPIISLFFAFVFYLFTSELYKAGLTHRTAGVLTAAAGDSVARFSGFSEVFIPHGGSYDIAVPNAENMEESPTGNQNDYGGLGIGSSSTAQGLTTVDTLSGVVVTDYSVGNLAFRRFYYAQPMALDGVVSSKVTETPSGLVGTITNGTSLSLADAAFTTGEGAETTFELGTIAPGATVSVKSAPIGRVPSLLTLLPHSQSRVIPPDQSFGYLTAFLPASQFGLQMGSDVSGRQSAILMMSIPISSKGAPE